MRKLLFNTNKMKILIAFCVFFVAIANSAPNCPENSKNEADKCAKEMFFLMDPNFRALKKDELPNYCTKLDANIKCVLNYGKNCLKGFTKQTLTIGMHGMKKHAKSICSPNAPLANNFIKNIDWIGKEQTDEVYTCASASIQNMIYIAKEVPSEKQIPEACCSYWLARKCMTDKLKSLTNDEKRVFIEEMTDNAMTNLIEFLCTKQNSIDTCKKIMPDTMSRLEKVFKEIKKGDKRKNESYLIPFLDVVAEDARN